MAEIGAIVLAAGRSSRFRAEGGEDVSKLVAVLDGKPLVRHAAEAALASRARPVVVVTGHAREAVEAALAGLPLLFAHNADFASGLASSLKAGVAALPSGVAGALVLLGDMPRIKAPLLDRLIGAFAARPFALAAAPVYAGRRGNPVLLARALFPALARLEGDEGARRLLSEADPQRIVEVEVESDGVTLDIDTPGELAAARNLRS
ncbi:MAG TPA: nucleotidyltransferase family protein [Roseiarcus sp.]|nr:nucleotidyltransferase family protein [Roseiarcus sp.]